MNMLLYRTFAAVAIVIAVYATVHLILAGGPQGAPNFLVQMYVGLVLLLGGAYFCVRQREVDWRERPEKLRSVRIAKQLLLVGASLMLVATVANLWP
jgi:hypothetical protein